MQKLRVAVVGCGRVSRTAHYSSIRENPNYEFVAVCDIDKERAEKWAGENRVKAYSNVDELLNNEKLDLVSVCVPNGLHANIGQKIAKHGVNVMAEKPLAMNTNDADALIDACNEAGVHLFTVMQNRYNETNRILKSCVDKGRFGRITSCHVTLSWHRELNYYTEDNHWRSYRDLAGGVFTNQAVHYVDMMQWLVGSSPESAYAKMGTAAFPVEVEDHGAGILRFKNGVIGSFALTNLAYPTDLEGSITVIGEKGYVKIGGKCMNKVEHWHFSDHDSTDEQIRCAETSPPTVYGFGHVKMYQAVADILLKGKSDLEVIDGREGRKAVAILEGFYLSDKTGNEIRFPIGKR